MDQVVPVYSGPTVVNPMNTSYLQKIRLAEKLRGGVILEVFNAEQAQIAQNAGVTALTVSEPIRQGVSRMMDPSLIKAIKQSVTIPIVARARVGHFIEAQILDVIGVDFIDENEVLAIADDNHFINKHMFNTSSSSPPFICGSQSLGEALRRIGEGAAMIRIQGDLEYGSIMKTVKNVKSVRGDLRALKSLRDDEVSAFSKKIEAPMDLVVQAKKCKQFPVMLFAAGGIVSPADAAMMMQLECDGVFIGSEIFRCPDPITRIKAIVEAVRSHNNPRVLTEVSTGLSAIITNKMAEPSGALSFV